MYLILWYNLSIIKPLSVEGLNFVSAGDNTLVEYSKDRALIKCRYYTL